MAWFGDKPFAQICAETIRVATPIDKKCLWCDEPIGPADNGFMEPCLRCGTASAEPWHQECLCRQIVGGVNHQAGMCVCCGGTLDPDPPHMTKREAARAAVSYADNNKWKWLPTRVTP